MQQKYAENHKQSISRVMEPSPSGYLYKTIPRLRLGEHGRREADRLQEQRIQELVVRLSLLALSQAT